MTRVVIRRMEWCTLVSKDEQPDMFPERFSRILFERYPSWQEYSVPPDLRWQSDSDMAVEVQSRFAPYCPLRIETMGHGVVISWAGWHDHCDGWGGEYSEEEFVAEALELITDILAEKRVTITSWIAAKVDSGGNCLVEELDDVLRNAPWAEAAKWLDIVVLSWKGTYDRGHFDPARRK